jgi:hypothetical protein
VPTPDYQQWLNEVWGWPNEEIGSFATLAAAANIAVGTNPPYSINCFSLVYPKFIGLASPLVGVVDGVNATVSAVAPNASLAPGQLVVGLGAGVPDGTVITAVTLVAVNLLGDVTDGVAAIVNIAGGTAGIGQGMPIAGAGIAPGSTVTGVGSTTLLLSLPATATAAQAALVVTAASVGLSAVPTVAGAASLAVYLAPLVPLAVINSFIFAASNSVQSLRWCELWLLGMQLYIAHYLTLWLLSDGTTPTSASQAASQGLARGILVSKAAGSVSAGYVPTPGLEDWGSWNLTQYGQIFASYAKAIGCGAMLVY